MDEDRVKITEEYLASLPIRQMQTANSVICSVRYDASIQTVYLLDAQGRYTGEKGHYRFDDDPSEEVAPPVFDPSESWSATAAQETASQNQGEEADDPEAKPKRKKRKWPLVVVVLLIVIASVSFEVMNIISERQEADKETTPTTVATDVAETTLPSDTTAPATEETAPVETSAPTNVNVIAAATNLLPGTVLDDASFTLIPVSETDYQQLCATTAVYKEEDIARLKGMECTAYISMGQYITQSDVALQYTAINPWGRNDVRQSLVYLPIIATNENLLSLCWGQYVDVEVTVETKIESPNTSTEPTEETTATTPGIEHHTSTVESTIVDTYKVQAAAIVDLLDSEGNSLFERYSVWSSVPAPFQSEVLNNYYQSLDVLATDVPGYICVAIPVEQAAILEVADPARMKVTISNPTPYIENELQQTTYSDMMQVMTVISGVWSNLSKTE